MPDRGTPRRGQGKNAGSLSQYHACRNIRATRLLPATGRDGDRWQVLDRQGHTLTKGLTKMSSPEFKAALKRYEHLAKTLGDEHDITTQAFTDCFYLAPPEYVEEAHRIAGEMNLLPDATGYLDDGSPMYS